MKTFNQLYESLNYDAPPYAYDHMQVADTRYKTKAFHNDAEATEFLKHNKDHEFLGKDKKGKVHLVTKSA